MKMEFEDQDRLVSREEKVWNVARWIEDDESRHWALLVERSFLVSSSCHLPVTRQLQKCCR